MNDQGFNNPYLVQRSGPASTARRFRAALLSAVLMLGAYPCCISHAQSGIGADQVQSPIPDQPEHGQEGSHELTPFFLIGIMINVVALTLFAVWAGREWKRKRPARRLDDE